MIVRCAACARRYQLDDHAIKEGGCLVRCAHCGHVWRQLLVAPGRNALVALAIPPAPVRVPEHKRTIVKFLVLFGISTIIITAVTIRDRIISRFPATRDVYTILGLSSGPYAEDALEIRSVSFHEKMPSGAILVKGEIVNTSQVVIEMPAVVISFVRAGRRNVVVKKMRERVTASSMSPLQTLHFQIPVSPPDQSFSFITVSFER